MVTGKPSVNPLGRTKNASSLARYVNDKTNGGEDLIDRLLEISENPDTPIRERLQATALLLDRAVGKALQPSEIAVSLDHVIPYPAEWVTFDQRTKLTWLRDFRRARLLGGGQ